MWLTYASLEWSSLNQLKVCCLYGTKPLLEPTMPFFNEILINIYLSEMWIEVQHFHARKWVWKCCLQNDSHLSRYLYVKGDGYFQEVIQVWCGWFPEVDSFCPITKELEGDITMALSLCVFVFSFVCPWHFICFHTFADKPLRALTSKLANTAIMKSPRVN